MQKSSHSTAVPACQDVRSQWFSMQIGFQIFKENFMTARQIILDGWSSHTHPFLACVIPLACCYFLPLTQMQQEISPISWTGTLIQPGQFAMLHLNVAELVQVLISGRYLKRGWLAAESVLCSLENKGKLVVQGNIPLNSYTSTQCLLAVQYNFPILSSP